METLKAKSVAALGLFDGVHLGHARVLSCAAEYKSCGFRPLCFTFDTTSLQIKQGRKIEYIYSDEQKCRYIREFGIENIISVDFKKISKLEPRDFVSEILKNQLNCHAVVCGEDFRFGRNACADINDLKSICDDFDIKVIIVPDESINGTKISSAAIRQALNNGDIATANMLLGREFSISGKVFCDRRNGTQMGTPTVNLKPIAPMRKGVYASKVVVDDEIFKGITNIGVRPTVLENSEIVAETHIFDFNRNLYGNKIEIIPYKFIRDEKRFDSVDELKAQISRDIETLRLF